jgi:anti-anti-sigma factor
MEITGENYRLSFDPETSTITCQGQLRLYGEKGYADITKQLNHIIEEKPETIILDLTALRFLNSSGINVFLQFVIKVRNTKASHLIVRGTHQFPWHIKTLKNLRRLMPNLVLEIN